MLRMIGAEIVYLLPFSLELLQSALRLFGDPGSDAASRLVLQSLLDLQLFPLDMQRL